MKNLRIVFAGTPAFGIPCLEALNKSQHELIAIYTQPDRPAGRGRVLQTSAVKDWAIHHHIRTEQPYNFKNQEARDTLALLQPDVLVVIAYGLLLPQTILDTPKYGCINVHASLLPSWRGASPIQHAILHGDPVSGVSIMQMDKGMDTGAVFTMKECPISSDDTSKSLHDKLSILAVDPLLSTLSALSMGTCSATPQDNAQASYAPKINKTDALIDWRRQASEIAQQIRAFNPWPVAYTMILCGPLRIYNAEVVPCYTQKEPGTVLALDKKGCLVATGKDALLITTLQFPGGKCISVKDWLNAGKNDLQINSVLGQTNHVL